MTSFLKGGLVAAALLGSTMIAGVAQAAPILTFVAGAPSPSAGYTVIDNFNTLAGLTISGNVAIQTPPSNPSGAFPANSVPANTPFLSVRAGGSAKYTFASPVSFFQFDWGSVDTYNRLIVNYGANQTITYIPGSPNFLNPANGNQFLPNTNGLATLSGEKFNSVTFFSFQNSFEVDNLAVRAVPEPATWAMMIGGFGAVGLGMRRSKAKVRAAKAFA